MTAASWGLLCLAYLLGLLASGLSDRWPSSAIALSLVALGGVLAVLAPRRWRTGPRWGGWLAAGLVAATAILYLQFRQPQPAANDISRFAGSAAEVVVTGEIVAPPSLNREQRVRLVLAVQRLNNDPNISGKLYVTLPLLHGTGLVPRQTIQVRGRIYEPPAAATPGSFDFRAYLAQRGIFAGLSGRLAAEPEARPAGLWQLRQRITRAQTRWLGSPTGPLLSSIALGRRAVDLPVAIRDRFTQAGLAHILAASGFHVSLLLSVVLSLTATLSSRQRLVLGGAVLLLYVGLTGAQPSVLRAAIMGGGALLGLATGRRRNPLGLLLVAAVGLLLYQPLWVWDLGFQLSFLATFGLLVTVPPLARWFDWLPPTLANAIAVPAAAALWTLPLLIYQFNTMALYGVLLNILATPLVLFVSLGGMVSAAIALIWPPAGSALALLPGYPARGLLWLTQVVNDWPGSTLVLGRLALWQLIAAYSCLLAVWRWPPLRHRRRWCLAGLVAMLAIALPLIYRQQSLVQITAFASDRQPVVVIQDRRQTALLGAGTPDTARYTLAPFLRQAGVRHLDWALALDWQPERPSGWATLADEVPVGQFLHPPLAAEQALPAIPAKLHQAIAANQQVQLGALAVAVLNLEPAIVQFQFHDQTWLLLDRPPAVVVPPPVAPQVLLWSGEPLPPAWLQAIQPQVAIATREIAPATRAQLQQHQIQTYTAGSAPIAWQPERGFQVAGDRLLD